MKVFISWSGEQSRRYAEAIRDWLPAVLQMVTPYFTPTDIEKGARWSSDIARELESSQVGIICITRDNLHADWILFEAGALSKSLDKSHVCPIIFGMSNTDLSGPLKQFQATEFEKTDFHKLIGLINNKLGDNKLPTRTLETVFEKWWPDLKAKVDQVAATVSVPTDPVRSERELIEEILILTRANQRNSGRSGISARAIEELLNAHIDLHDYQTLEEGGYQDTLDALSQAKKPLRHIAGRYKGQSEVLDALIERLDKLTYEIVTKDEADDEDIPF